MWFSIAALTWEPGRLLTQPGSWACQTRLWPRTRALWALAQDTIWSPGPKLKEFWRDSVVSHFISLPGVTMSNWTLAMFISPLMFRSPSVNAVPKYLPSASARPRSVVAAAAGWARVSTATIAADRATASTPIETLRDLATSDMCVSFLWGGALQVRSVRAAA